MAEYEDDAGLDEDQEAGESELDDLHVRAMARFEEAVVPQLDQRALSLAARRFVSIAGAQWEGDWADPYENAIKLEINKTGRGVEKIQRDYRENRIVPDFRPAGGRGDQDSADTLDGMHRADDYHFKSSQARDNAFDEASAGGFGAYRLATDWADPYDKDSDHQRINPGLIITDADQRVFFDPSDETYDKSKSRYAFLLTPKLRSCFEEEYEEAVSSWPNPKIEPTFDWFTPDVVIVAEYYEVEDVADRLMIFTHALSGEEQRWWKSELEPDEIAELKAKGWKLETRSGRRRRISKAVLSGAEVLKGPSYIAGSEIPVVPVYGKRWFIDGIERFAGYVQEKMDSQRLYNSLVSRLSEASAMSPRQLPIFDPEQIDGPLKTLWERQVIDRHPYALAKALRDPNTGAVIQAGPTATLPAASVSAADAALIQLAANDIVEDQQDGSDTVRANTSEEAMQHAAARVDARSGIYLDNMRQSVQREGEIWLSMGGDVYWEPGREVETMTEDGDDGVAVLQQPYTDPKTGVSGTKNDFSRGRFKVVVSVTEATATRRDKTVKACTSIAEMMMQLDPELAQAAAITAISNMDGEGMSDLQKFARKKALMSGLAEPTEDEQAEMEKAAQQQQQQPDPQAEFIAAKTEESQAAAGEKKASAMLKLAQAHAVGGPEQAPEVPDGLEAAHKVAEIRKTAAEAHNLETTTAHIPQKLAIEGANAATNRMKAEHSRIAASPPPRIDVQPRSIQ